MINTNSNEIRYGNKGPFFRVGTEVETGKSVFVDVSLLKAHGHLLGKSGSHKTLFMVALLVFLILTTEAVVVFLDFGGDRFALNALKEAAARAGKKFRFQSIDPRHDSSCFNPLQAFWPLTEDVADRLTDYLVASLSLDPGEGEHRYFGRVNWSTIDMATKALIRAGIVNPTFEDYRCSLAAIARTVRRNDAVESLLAFQQLASLKCLQSAQKNAPTIDYDDILTNGNTVTVLTLPTLLSPTARAVGGLNLFSLVQAAMERDEAGAANPHQVFVGIDEFQQIARDSKPFESLETLCRKLQIGLLMANQSLSQLAGKSIDLRDVVFDNTNVKFYLTPNDDHVIDKILSKSKDTVRELIGRSVGGSFGLDVSSQTRPYVTRSFERNDCIEAAALSFHGVLMVDDGLAQHEPIHLRFDPGVTIDEHTRLRNLPIPKRNPKLALTAAPNKTPITKPRRVKRHKGLRSLEKKIRKNETFRATV